MILAWMALVLACTYARAQDTPSFTFSKDVAEARLWLATQDRHGAPVTDLESAHTLVFDNGSLQHLSTFTRVEDGPVRVHFVVDVSRSGQPSLPAVESAVSEFVKVYSRPGDRVRITAFSDHSIAAIVSADASQFWIAAAKLIGRPVTAVYDNLHDALVDSEDYDAVVLISDGDDNWSMRYNLLDILKDAQRLHARVFTIGLLVKRSTICDEVLQRISDAGSGQRVNIPSTRLLGKLNEIGVGLRTYYALSFSIPEERRDGNFHRVALKIDDARVAHIQAKSGYVAPLPRPRASAPAISTVALQH
jgi:hypothetical protein